MEHLDLVTSTNKLPFFPEIPLDPEHELSYKIGGIIYVLAMYSARHAMNATIRFDQDTEDQIRIWVEEIWHTYFSKQADTRKYPRDYNPRYVDHSIHDEPLEREITTITDRLRDIWRKQYYLPRTRQATAVDYQRWLNAYIEKYKEAGFKKTKRVEASFDGYFHPCNGELDSDLRVSTVDVKLIPGWGGRHLQVIEQNGTRVDMAIPQASSHHRIYSLRIPPDKLFDYIYVPCDIDRPRI